MANGDDLKRWSTGVQVTDKSSNTATYRSSSVDVLDNNTTTTATPDTRAKSMECLIDDDEQPPAVPPRNASLKSSPLIQTTPPKMNQPERNIMIHVSDTTISHPKQPEPYTQPYTQPHPHTHTHSHAYEEIEIGVSSKYNKLEISPKQQSNDSDYDHLFPGKKQHRPVIRRKKSHDKENNEDHVFTPVRRNESLPPMVFNSPVVEKPEVPPKDYESGVSDSEIDEPVSPLPSNNYCEEGVIMRQKSSTSDDSPDPFVDLLSAPPNKSRLRWSQELNPIYDYIKGVKISPKLGYDSLATTAENIIQEEDMSIGTGDDSVSLCSSDRRSSSDSQFEGLVFVQQSAPNTLQRVKRMPHNYEEVVFGPRDNEDRSSSRPHSEHYNQPMEDITIGGNNESQTIRSSPLRRLKSSDSPFAVSPQINKRVLPRKSKTVRARDDSNAPQGSQQARHVADTMRVSLILLPSRTPLILSVVIILCRIFRISREIIDCSLLKCRVVM